MVRGRSIFCPPDISGKSSGEHVGLCCSDDAGGYGGASERKIGDEETPKMVWTSDESPPPRGGSCDGAVGRRGEGVDGNPLSAERRWRSETADTRTVGGQFDTQVMEARQTLPSRKLLLRFWAIQTGGTMKRLQTAVAILGLESFMEERRKEFRSLCDPRTGTIPAARDSDMISLRPDMDITELEYCAQHLVSRPHREFTDDVKDLLLEFLYDAFFAEVYQKDLPVLRDLRVTWRRFVSYCSGSTLALNHFVRDEKKNS